MINLMPAEMKETLLYARRNLSLGKWLVAVLAGLAGIGIVILAGNYYVDSSSRNYAKDVENRKQQLQSLKLEDTKRRVDEISSNTRLALQVLSRQVIFSEILKQIGTVMPSGSSLQNLSINRLEGGLDLQAAVADYQTGTQVQVNITDPRNKIFEKADIISITCQTENLTNPRYPCLVNIRALFAKDSPFLFASKQGASQ